MGATTVLEAVQSSRHMTMASAQKQIDEHALLVPSLVLKQADAKRIAGADRAFNSGRRAPTLPSGTTSQSTPSSEHPAPSGAEVAEVARCVQVFFQSTRAPPLHMHIRLRGRGAPPPFSSDGEREWYASQEAGYRFGVRLRPAVHRRGPIALCSAR